MPFANEENKPASDTSSETSDGNKQSSSPQTMRSTRLKTVACSTAVLLVGFGIGIAGGYGIWGKQSNAPKGDPTTAALYFKGETWADHLPTRSIIQNWDDGIESTEHTFTVEWEEYQSYQYKNVLFDKQCSYHRNAPLWEQNNLISGAARNEGVAMMSRAVIMDSNAVNTDQLPYRFNFTLVGPAFIGDEEEFEFHVDYSGDSEDAVCDHATVTGVGKINGKVRTLSNIAYKCMAKNRRGLLAKGYKLRADL